MFVIERVFMDDKNVPLVLRALAGLVRSMDVPKPVANLADGKGAPKAASDGSLLVMFERYIRTRPAKTSLSPADVKQWLTAHGKSPSTVFYLTNMAIKHRLLRRTGSGAKVQYIPIMPTTKKKG